MGSAAIKIKNPYPLEDEKPVRKRKRSGATGPSRVRPRNRKLRAVGNNEPAPVKRGRPKRGKAKPVGWEPITDQADISGDPVAIGDLLSDLSLEINALSTDLMSIRVKRGKLFSQLLDAFGGKYDPFWTHIESQAGVWHVTKGSVKQEIALWQFCTSFPEDDRSVMECVTYAALKYFRSSFKDSEFRHVLDSLKKRKGTLDKAYESEKPEVRNAVIVKELKALAAGYKKRHAKKTEKENAKVNEEEKGNSSEPEDTEAEEEADEEVDETVGLQLSGTPSTDGGNAIGELNHGNLIRVTKNTTTFLKNYSEMVEDRDRGICGLSELDFTHQAFVDLDKEVRHILDRLTRVRDMRDNTKKIVRSRGARR